MSDLVFEVFVSNGNQSTTSKSSTNAANGVLKKDKGISVLEGENEGIFGFFNSESQESFDKDTVPESFFIGMRTASGIKLLGDSSINIKDITSITKLKKVDEVTQKIGIAGNSSSTPAFHVIPDTIYTLNVRFKSPYIFNMYGQNGFTLTFSVKSNLADPNILNQPGDCNDVPAKLAKLINRDKRGLIKAYLYDAGGTKKETDTEIDAYVSANKAKNTDVGSSAVSDVCFKRIVLEVVPEKINSYLNLNLQYDYPRTATMEVSFISGFNGQQVIEAPGHDSNTSTISPVTPQGLAYDMKHLEYMASGLGGKPGVYKTNTITGTTKENFEYHTNDSNTYDQYVIDYRTIDGNLTVLSNSKRVIIARKSGNQTAFETILTAIATKSNIKIIGS